jgi:NMD protein affecting ribosome stability and mRNA decay
MATRKKILLRRKIRMDSKCVQCGSEDDLMVAFTKHKICGECVKKNHKQALRRSNA